MSYYSESYPTPCSLSAAPAELRPIGVDQPPGSGDNYPFVRPENGEETIIGDLFLRFNDDDAEFEYPFKVEWLAGFGCGPAWIPISLPNGLEHLLISDNQDQTVFDTRTLSYTRKAWGPRAWLLQWEDPTNYGVLRVVYYELDGGAEDFPFFVSLTNGLLDGRAVQLRTPRVLSIQIEDDASSLVGLDGTENRLELAGGFNTDIETEDSVLTDGERRQGTITIGMEPGLGEGRYQVDCDAVAGWGIKKINTITPTDYGDFNITAEDNSCSRIQRPWNEQLTDPIGGCRTAKIRTAAVELDADCSACCTCDDFISVYEAIRKLTEDLTDLVARAHAVRDWILTATERLQNQRECREDHLLRAYAQAECPDKAACVVSFCNSTDQCLKNVLVPISFDYTDTLDPDISAVSLYNGEDPDGPKEICGFTKRAGNVSERSIYQLALPYTLGGEYPHYWAFFDAIEPYSMGYVMFLVRFPASVMGDMAKFAIDAYSLPASPTVDPDEATLPFLTDYDYTIGSGPDSSSAACISWRLVAQPILAGCPLTQRPCCVDDLSDWI